MLVLPRSRLRSFKRLGSLAARSARLSRSSLKYSAVSHRSRRPFNGAPVIFAFRESAVLGFLHLAAAGIAGPIVYGTHVLFPTTVVERSLLRGAVAWRRIANG